MRAGALPQAVPLWPWHRARLSHGGCDDDLIACVESEVSAAIHSYEGPWGPRVRISVQVTPYGDVSVSCERRLSSLDVPAGPVLAVVTMDPVPEPAPGPAKPMERSAWDAALRRAQEAGAQQAVLADTAGEVVDGSTASVWAVMGGVLHTPPSPRAIPGVARAWLLENAGELDLRAEVTRLRAEDLALAEEVFLTNALAGAVAARGKGGPVSTAVIAAFMELWATL